MNENLEYKLIQTWEEISNREAFQEKLDIKKK